MAGDAYKFRRELLEKLPKLGLFNGLGAILLYVSLWPWSVEPKKNKAVFLAPSSFQKVCSAGSDGISVELLVASRTAVKPGRYLATCDGKHWQWLCLVARDNGWSHVIVRSPIGKGDTAGAVAIAVVGVALLATLTIVVLSRANS